jgi:hypothetical protein
MFFVGDSGAYLLPLSSNLFPGDRSFVYGFIIIKYVMDLGGSLTTLVIAQSLCSAISALLVAAVLRVGFGAHRGIAAVAALAYAIEPMALLYERFVMTECLAMLALAGFIFVELMYLQRPRIVLIVWLAVLSTCVVAFRVAYLPVLLVSMLVLLIVVEMKSRTKRAAILQRSLHALVLVGITFVCHQIYKSSYHYLSGRPAVYNDSDGLYMLAAWSSLLRRSDFPDPSLYDTIIPQVQPSLGRSFNQLQSDYGWVSLQRFGSQGLIMNIIRTQPSYEEANQLAKIIALNIAKRDPIGVLGLGVRAYFDYWDRELMTLRIRIDLGHREMERMFIDFFQNRFNENISGHHLVKTFTKAYYAGGILWYRILLIAPALSVLAFFTCRSRRRELSLMAIYAFGIVATYCILVPEPWVRYLHGMAWITIVLLGVLACCLMGFLHKRSWPKYLAGPKQNAIREPVLM